MPWIAQFSMFDPFVALSVRGHKVQSEGLHHFGDVLRWAELLACGIFGVKHFGVILAWVVVVVAASLAVFAFLAGVGYSYHPQKDGAHLREFHGAYAGGVFFVSVFLAFFITHKRAAWSVITQTVVLGGFCIAAFVGHSSYVALHPQATHFLIRVAGQYYAMPRGMTSAGGDRRLDMPEMQVILCITDMKRYDDAGCKAVKGMLPYVNVSVSERPITQSFLVYDRLKTAGVTYDGDQLGSIPSDVAQLDGVVRLEEAGLVLMLELDRAQNIERAVSCRTGQGRCQVFVHTDHGRMAFTTLGDAVVDVARWDADQARYGAMFDAWRCREATCGGLFKEGERKAYE